MTDEIRRHLERLARAVADTAPEELDCDAVLGLVGGYLETIERGEDLDSELQMVRQHLSVCPECREEFDALLAYHRSVSV
jgi:hypothetical protein